MRGLSGLEGTTAAPKKNAGKKKNEPKRRSSWGDKGEKTLPDPIEKLAPGAKKN